MGAPLAFDERAALVIHHAGRTWTSKQQHEYEKTRRTSTQSKEVRCEDPFYLSLSKVQKQDSIRKLPFYFFNQMFHKC